MYFQTSLHIFTLSLHSSIRVKVLILLYVISFCRVVEMNLRFFLFSPVPFYIKDWHFTSTSLHFYVNYWFY